MASELSDQKVNAAIRKIAWSRSPGKRRSEENVLYTYRNTLAPQLTTAALAKTTLRCSIGLYEGRSQLIAADRIPVRLYALEKRGILAPLAGTTGPSRRVTMSAPTCDGVRLARSCGFARRSISASTAPGLRQIALIPWRRPSTASASVRPTSPYFETL